MKIIQSIKNILSGLYLSIKRFPASILFSASTAAVLIAISELRPAQDDLAKIAMVLALGIPLSLSVKLCIERKNTIKLYMVLVSYIASALFLVMYYFILLPDFKMVQVTRYIAVSLTLYLTFIFIPYFHKRENFENYVITLFSGFFITLLYSIVLYGGLSAILFAVDKLLGVTIKSQVYYYTWLLVVFLFGVTYFLAGIPKRNEELSANTYPKLLKILLLYIVMPLISAYTIILYIYFAKIIATWQWPVNIVTHLVLWYSVISVLVLFFITPLKQKNKWAFKFLKLFPKIILPILIMMFISIYIRINAYGVTENRYFISILALWVFMVMGYFAFNRKIKTILLPVFLSIFALIAVLGPLSSYSLSIRSQNKRLELVLLKNNMLNQGIEPSSDISKEDKIKISSILDYFNRNHSLKDVKLLPKDFRLENMNKIFGFSYEYPSYSSPNNYFSFKRIDTDKAVEIGGFDYLFGRSIFFTQGKSTVNDLTVEFNNNSDTVKISYQGKVVYNKSLDTFIKNIIEQHGAQSKEGALPAEELTITEENDKIKVKFIILNLSGMIDQSSQSINHSEVDFYLLVKVK